MKVSQATIDKIKKMGMTKALASAKGGSAEFKEGLRRMYGERRLKAAMGSTSSPSRGTGRPGPSAGSAKVGAAKSKPRIKKSVVSAATAAKNREAMKKRSAASKDMSTKAGQRASESKTLRGVNTMDGNRFKKNMTPKQRQAARLRAQAQGRRSSKVAGRVSSVASMGMGPLGLGLGAAGQAGTGMNKKKMQKSASKYYTIDRKTGKRKK
jgi:hypothetical protein